MRIRVLIRTKTFYLLVARKNITLQELADELEITKGHLSDILANKKSPSPELRRKIIEFFRGASHKPGGRVSWDDIFRPQMSETGASV